MRMARDGVRAKLRRRDQSPVAGCNITPDTTPRGSATPTPITPDLLTRGQPCQQVVNITGPFGDDSLANRQRGFDFYSWLTFIAMNSPADGNAGKQALFGDDLAKKLNDSFTRQFRCRFLVEQTPDPANKVTLSKTFTDGPAAAADFLFPVGLYTEGNRRRLPDEAPDVQQDGDHRAGRVHPGRRQ
jgi:hypothetical protein